MRDSTFRETSCCFLGMSLALGPAEEAWWKWALAARAGHQELRATEHSRVCAAGAFTQAPRAPACPLVSEGSLILHRGWRVCVLRGDSRTSFWSHGGRVHGVASGNAAQQLLEGKIVANVTHYD